MIKPSDKVVFYEGIEDLFFSLPNEDPLKKGLMEAIKKIKKDFQSGEHISPKSNLAINCLKKYGAKNIRILDLPQFYRLIYSIAPSEIEIISVILDWPTHKRYDQLCKKKI